MICLMEFMFVSIYAPGGDPFRLRRVASYQNRKLQNPNILVYLKYHKSFLTTESKADNRIERFLRFWQQNPKRTTDSKHLRAHTYVAITSRARTYVHAGEKHLLRAHSYICSDYLARMHIRTRAQNIRSSLWLNRTHIEKDYYRHISKFKEHKTKKISQCQGAPKAAERHWEIFSNTYQQALLWTYHQASLTRANGRKCKPNLE